MLRPEELTSLGIRYADLCDGADRDAVLLGIMQAFHPYVLKYLRMIVTGHLPTFRGVLNADAVVLLRYFMPPGTAVPDERALAKVCRTLHLAFKGEDAGAIYDTLTECLLPAVRNYDPYYTHRVAAAVKAIDERTDVALMFTAEDLGVEDVDSILRLLARKGYLRQVQSKSSKAGIAGYQRRISNWPPPKRFLRSKPIGLAHHVQTRFRMHLQRLIENRMNLLESRAGIMQLDALAVSVHNKRGTGESVPDPLIPHADGALADGRGQTWAADVALWEAPLDVGTMNLQWVLDTKDPLFSDLTRSERRACSAEYCPRAGFQPCPAVFWR